MQEVKIFSTGLSYKVLILLVMLATNSIGCNEKTNAQPSVGMGQIEASFCETVAGKKTELLNRNHYLRTMYEYYLANKYLEKSKKDHAYKHGIIASSYAAKIEDEYLKASTYWKLAGLNVMLDKMDIAIGIIEKTTHPHLIQAGIMALIGCDYDGRYIIPRRKLSLSDLKRIEKLAFRALKNECPRYPVLFAIALRYIELERYDLAAEIASRIIDPEKFKIIRQIFTQRGASKKIDKVKGTQGGVEYAKLYNEFRLAMKLNDKELRIDKFGQLEKRFVELKRHKEAHWIEKRLMLETEDKLSVQNSYDFMCVADFERAADEKNLINVAARMKTVDTVDFRVFMDEIEKEDLGNAVETMSNYEEIETKAIMIIKMEEYCKKTYPREGR